MKEFFTGGLTATALMLAAAISLHLQPAPPQTARYPQFENDAVKAWRTVVSPNQPTAMHRHDHPRVVVALTDGSMRFIDQNGKAEDHPWQAGKAYWLPAMPPATMHSDVNAGAKPLEVVVVELEKEK